MVGGTLTYKYLSATSTNVIYSVTLELYRDCSGGVNTTVQFEPDIDIGIYHNNTKYTKYKTSSLELVSKNLVPFTNCYNMSVMCMEKGIYSNIISLETSTIGYYLKYITCCRPLLNNVKDDNGTPNNGFTFISFINPSSYQYNAPTYNFNPMPLNGINQSIKDDWGSTDIDNDSLVYEIVVPYKGGTNTGWSPPPNMATLESVDYRSGYSSVSPFGSDGNVSIDKKTGIVSMVNKVTGTFAFCVETKEYRKGV